MKILIAILVAALLVTIVIYLLTSTAKRALPTLKKQTPQPDPTPEKTIPNNHPPVNQPDPNEKQA